MPSRSVAFFLYLYGKTPTVRSLPLEASVFLSSIRSSASQRRANISIKTAETACAVTEDTLPIPRIKRWRSMARI